MSRCVFKEFSRWNPSIVSTERSLRRSGNTISINVFEIIAVEDCGDQQVRLYWTGGSADVCGTGRDVVATIVSLRNGGAA